MARNSLPSNNTQPSNDGFSLVELLIATTLGLLIISGMIAVFSGNKQSSELNSAMTDIQESARFALDKISDDIRMSGFQGCVDINRGAGLIIASDPPTSDFHASAVTASQVGTGNAWNPAPPLGFKTENHDAIAGTHALTLQFGDASTFPLTAQLQIGGIPNAAGPVIVNTSPGVSSRSFDISQDDYAIISNCSTAEIFRVSAVADAANTATIAHTAPANNVGAFQQIYGDADSIEQTSVMRFNSNTYYVGDTGLTNEQGDPVTALYQQALPYGDPVNNPPTELVRGIENFRVAFGVRTSISTLSYMRPTDPGFDSREIESVRIGLLMTSYDRISQIDDQNTYVLAGQSIVPSSAAGGGDGFHAGDRRFRLAFNTTVKVRNRRNN